MDLETGQDHADASTAETQEQGLRKHLPDHAASARTQCGPHSKFVDSAGGACEEKTGSIAAGNQEYQGDGSRQQAHERSDGPDCELQKRLEQSLSATRERVVQSIEPGNAGAKFSLCLPYGHALPEARDYPSTRVITIGLLLRG
jgi:hypothetical protein